MALLSGLATQPATLAIGAGLLAGAIAGTAVVASGVLSSPPADQLALVACPDSDTVVARVTSGQSLLVTARSGDGAWLQLYIGEPGVDRGWAPAAVLRTSDSVDALPVAGCEVAVVPPGPPTPAPAPTPTPEITAEITLAPGVTPSPTPVPTPTPKPTPTKSLPPGATLPPPTPTPLPPPPTIPPPTPIPTPGPTADLNPPEISKPTNDGPLCDGDVHRCVWRPSAVCSAVHSVTVTATGADLGGSITEFALYYQPFGGSVTKIVMTYNGGINYSALIIAQDSWNDGKVTYWVQAVDQHSNYTPATYPLAVNELYVGQCFG